MLSSLSVRLARSFALLLPWLMYPFHLWELQQQQKTLLQLTSYFSMGSQNPIFALTNS